MIHIRLLDLLLAVSAVAVTTLVGVMRWPLIYAFVGVFFLTLIWCWLDFRSTGEDQDEE